MKRNRNHPQEMARIRNQMWRPENSIRHQLPETRWPAAEEAAASLLFSPIRVGRLTLECRTWVPAMGPWRATAEGLVTRKILPLLQRIPRRRPAPLTG